MLLSPWPTFFNFLSSEYFKMPLKPAKIREPHNTPPYALVCSPPYNLNFPSKSGEVEKHGNRILITIKVSKMTRVISQVQKKEYRD